MPLQLPRLKGTKLSFFNIWSELICVSLKTFESKPSSLRSFRRQTLFERLSPVWHKKKKSVGPVSTGITGLLLPESLQQRLPGLWPHPSSKPFQTVNFCQKNSCGKSLCPRDFRSNKNSWVFPGITPLCLLRQSDHDQEKSIMEMKFKLISSMALAEHTSNSATQAHRRWRQEDDQNLRSAYILKLFYYFTTGLGRWLTG